MTNFTKNVYWSAKDECWVVEVPELPGCLADGDSKEEDLKNADLIIEEWIETAKRLGREVP